MNILIGITGGIAAYKIPELVRLCRRAGANVRVVMTAAANAFITPMTLQAVSGHPVAEDLFDCTDEAAMDHITLARWADIICIAPASADVIARLAQGHANDLLSTLCLASRAPLFIAPAMNQQMWLAPATQANMAILQGRGVTVMGPGFGDQACGEWGPGRMLEPDDIAQHLLGTPRLQGQKVVITAGPTREKLDPVRYISNYSSGKMGFALAEAAYFAGAETTLIAGPCAQTCVAGIRRIDVESAEQMHAAVMHEMANTTIFIACAAVADYRPKVQALNKIKKMDDEMAVTFIKNKDSLAEVANLPQKPFCVGFAAETQDMIANAKEKMRRKKLDMIIANPVGSEATGFESDDNTISIIFGETVLSFDKQSKADCAKHIINSIIEQFILSPQEDDTHELEESTIKNS